MLAFRNRQESASSHEPSAEAVAMKEYWSTLSVERRQEILRFQERALVNELYDVQQSLYASDFECALFGIRSNDDARRRMGIEYFDVEGVLDCKGKMFPRAFIAHRAFVELDNLFEFIEERLGRPLLQDAPPLEEKHWVSLLTPTPSSWAEYVRVALRLVELAIQREAAREQRARDQIEAAREEVVPPSPSGTKSQGAKRKARKKQTALRHAAEAAAEAEAEAEAEAAAEAEAGSEAEAEAKAEAEAEEAEAETESEAEDDSQAQAVTLEMDQQEDAALNQQAAGEPEVFYIGSYTEESPCAALSESASATATTAGSDERDSLPFFPVDACDTASGTANAEPEHFASLSLERNARDTSSGASPAVSIEQDPIHTAPGPFESCPQIAPVAFPQDEPMDQGKIRTCSSETFDAEPALSATQSLRHTAREARVGATVTPALIAASASRAAAREAWVSAEIGMRGRSQGHVFAPWRLADGSSGEHWVKGFRAVVKNTFLDIEQIMVPESCAVRAHSCPAYGGA